MFKKNLILLIFTVIVNNSHSQAISSNYQKNCTQEQVKEHENLKNKSPKEADFNSFCSCVASLISDLRLGDLNYLLSVKPTLQH